MLYAMYGDSSASGRLAQQGFVQGLVSALERASGITWEVDIKRKGSDYVLTAVVCGTRYQDAIFLYDVAVYNSRSISCL